MLESPKQDTLFVASLEKGMKLLAAFNAEQAEMGLQELAEASGLDKSATQRFANTFHVLGYLDKDPVTRRYRPSVRILDLTNAYLWANPLIRLAMPELVELRQRIGETINLALLDGPEIIYAIRLPAARTSFAATIIGRRATALNTASGRAMVSGLGPEDRRRCVAEWPLTPYIPSTLMDRSAILDLVEDAARNGYAISQSEIRLNEMDLAAPIQMEGGFHAAVHCSVSAMTWSRERIIQEIMPHLVDTASTLSLPPPATDR